MSMCERVHQCLATECTQLVSFPAGQKKKMPLPLSLSLHRPLPFFLLTATFTMTSVSANMRAVAMAAHKDIFGRGKRLGWHIQPSGPPIPTPLRFNRHSRSQMLRFIKPSKAPAHHIFGLSLCPAWALLPIKPRVSAISASPLLSSCCVSTSLQHPAVCLPLLSQD